MKISFKQFSQIMDLPEITEDKLDEIFGFFKNSDKIAQAKKKREELTKKLGAQQYALRLKQNNQKMAAANKAANAPSPARKDPRSASGAKAAEMDWIKSMQSEGVFEDASGEASKIIKGEMDLYDVITNPFGDAQKEISKKLKIQKDRIAKLKPKGKEDDESKVARKALTGYLKNVFEGESKAYRAGFSASRAGKSMTKANPYKSGSDEWMEFNDGFTAGESVEEELEEGVSYKGVPYTKYTSEQWYAMLKKMEKTTAKEFADQEYIAERILVHASHTGENISAMKAKNLAKSIAQISAEKNRK